jgi:TusA-related sulfurtransferase
MEKLQPGEVLEVVFDNPSSSESISAMADAAGHEIVAQQQVNGKFTWKIKKAA